MKMCVVPAVAGFMACALGSSAMAGTLNAADISGLDLGLAGGHAVVSLGKDAKLEVKSGPITGSVLVGKGSDFKATDDDDSAVTGGVFSDNKDDKDEAKDLATPADFTPVSGATTAQAKQDAAAVAAYAAGLDATQSFDDDVEDTIFSRMGTLNVIDVDGDIEDEIGFDGFASDIFIVRVSGDIDFEKDVSLTGGVTASNILWVLDTDSGYCLETDKGAQIVGTFLATNGCNFKLETAELTGALINTDGDVKVKYDSKINAASFTTPTPVPLPAPVLMLGAAVAGLGFMRKRKSKEA